MTTLDKIRAEIEQIKPYDLPWDKRTPERIRDMALDIIDKYAESCTDAISREELLKAIDTWDKFGCDADTKLVPYKDHYIPYIHYDDVVKAIKDMPTVQPKPIECDDSISRKSLKNKLQEQHDFFVNAYGGFSNLPQSDKARVDEMTNCIAMVVNEPPITPQQKMSKNDGIPEQWQELKETITEMRDNDGTCTQQEVCKFLANYMDVLEKQMQEPKTGHWIKGEEWCETVDGFERWGNDYTCSECGVSLGRYTLTDFCPNCGARMVEPKESEDKK